MRLASLVLLGITLITSPTMAQSGKAILGSYTCSQSVPCPGSGEAVSAAGWARYGNACVTQAFGYSNPNGFIDETAGLNESKYMTAKPDAIQRGAASQLSPQCYVLQLPSKSCFIHCDLVTQ